MHLTFGYTVLVHQVAFWHTGIIHDHFCTFGTVGTFGTSVALCTFYILHCRSQCVVYSFCSFECDWLLGSALAIISRWSYRTQRQNLFLNRNRFCRCVRQDFDSVRCVYCVRQVGNQFLGCRISSTSVNRDHSCKFFESFSA